MALDRHTRLAELKAKEQRGSRARCVLLTDGPREVVAGRLNSLFAPYAHIDPKNDAWAPAGFDTPREVKLGESRLYLSAEHRELVTAWWLKLRSGANTPNWDLVSTATIEGRRGLVLVEAKAHANEIKASGKPASGDADNHVRISEAIAEANAALNNVMPGWALTADHCYQLCNRFAWSWKIASLGVPVVLVYLGFVRAGEMSDVGLPFADGDVWRTLVQTHAQGLVPAEAWNAPMRFDKDDLRATIRSMELPLSGL